jgi:hypothetical protein
MKVFSLANIANDIDNDSGLGGVDIKFKQQCLNLIEYVEVGRGIPRHLFNLLNVYQVLEKPFGSPVSKNYFFVGIPNYKKNGCVATSYYSKMSVKSMGVKEPIFMGNSLAKKMYIFSSTWDFLAFLKLKGKGANKALEEDFFVVYNQGAITKTMIKLYEDTYNFEDRMNEINLLLRDNKGGNTATNNFKNIYGEKAIDRREYFTGFSSLSKMVIGEMKDENN